MVRTGWYEEHPPGCTCWRCNEGRAGKPTPVRVGGKRRRGCGPIGLLLAAAALAAAVAAGWAAVG